MFIAFVGLGGVVEAQQPTKIPERVCRARGYDPVIICTPEELLEE